MKYPADMHFWILVIIILLMGAFGGLLNHLHNFDTNANDEKNRFLKYKYIFLGIGAAALVPAFLKMIASDLIKNTNDFDNNSFLIFGGFCLVSAIFSRRFINTIGERILEAAKNAEMTSKENKKQLESTKLELTSTQERIEDVKVSIGLNNPDMDQVREVVDDPKGKLLILVDSYIEKTSISDYVERLKVKAEIGRKMGQIIVRHNLPKQHLLSQHPKEGMYLAIAYSVDLKPDHDGLSMLNQIANVATQLYTKYVILIGYRTLASNGMLKATDVEGITKIVNGFRKNADNALIRNIEDALHVLSFINPTR